MFSTKRRLSKRPEFPVQSKQGEPTTYDENSPSNGVTVGQALEKLVYVNTPSCQKKVHRTHSKVPVFAIATNHAPRWRA
jgi:hypothetical protein